jgi:hypothetical protein
MSSSSFLLLPLLHQGEVLFAWSLLPAKSKQDVLIRAVDMHEFSNNAPKLKPTQFLLSITLIFNWSSLQSASFLEIG